MAYLGRDFTSSWLIVIRCGEAGIVLIYSNLYKKSLKVLATSDKYEVQLKCDPKLFYFGFKKNCYYIIYFNFW